MLLWRAASHWLPSQYPRHSLLRFTSHINYSPPGIFPPSIHHSILQFTTPSAQTPQFSHFLLYFLHSTRSFFHSLSFIYTSVFPYKNLVIISSTWRIFYHTVITILSIYLSFFKYKKYFISIDCVIFFLSKTIHQIFFSFNMDK